MPAACAERMPACESSIAAHRSGATPSRRAVSMYTSGAGFPRATSSEETVARKNDAIPASSSTVSISGRFDDDASPSGNRSASRCTASTAPGTSGRCSRYAASIRSTTSALIASGSSGTPALSWR